MWQPIETAPKDGTVVILANFSAMCLLTGAPHVWTARLASEWINQHGETRTRAPEWVECSYAATNENGEPTHWMPLPSPPETGDDARPFAPTSRQAGTSP